MYHLELRKFPHVVCRFNQSEAQLRALVIPWTRQEWIEEGERKWNVNEATLTILEGPELSMPDLAMGKGWRNAQKRSEDVTERVLGGARKAGEAQQEQHGAASPGAVGGAGEGAPVAPAGEALGGPAEAQDLQLLADSLGLELLALLDGGPVAPSRVWLMAQERLGERGGAASAAEALGLAERAVGSLLGRGLAVLRGDGRGEGERPAEGDEQAGDDRQAGDVIALERKETVLAAVETWAGGGRPPVVIARKI
ncbi:MAG TPA: hypothetical protein VLJ80_10570 [Solirubrobacteraceae bacterium]|nr:hypothetical protein [Solirubrobacteraceae bacterium]